MKRLQVLIFALLFILAFQDCKSQTKVNISKPELELQGNRVKITYDIIDFTPNDEFNVWIEVEDGNGKLINAKSLSGDIGKQVKGGKGKEIAWDFEADGIILSEGTSIQVYANLITPTKTETPVDLQTNTNSFSTRSIVLQSLLFPGLGLSRATGKPHWLRGVAGYGCILTSLAYNQISQSSYDDYKGESDIGARDDLFNTSVSQDNVSEAFAYAAIGIWVIDIVWNVIGTSKLNKQTNVQAHRFTITPSFEPTAMAPMLAFSLKF